MARVIDEADHVKIFVLYLMENINYPMDFCTINDIVMQTEFVMYIDFAESFHTMLDDGLIVRASATPDGTELYSVTEKGRIVARELHGDILPTILSDSLKWALRYLDFQKRGIVTSSKYEKREDGRFDFLCSYRERGVEIYSLHFVTDTEERAKQMKKNFDNNPEVVFRGTCALLEGQVNYIFDK